MKVLLFTAQNCIPCRQLKPTMAKLQEQYGFALESIEASAESQPIFTEYGVRAAPTVIALNDAGERVGMFAGAQGIHIVEARLREWGVIK